MQYFLSEPQSLESKAELTSKWILGDEKRNNQLREDWALLGQSSNSKWRMLLSDEGFF